MKNDYKIAITFLSIVSIISGSIMIDSFNRVSTLGCSLIFLGVFGLVYYLIRK